METRQAQARRDKSWKTIYNEENGKEEDIKKLKRGWILQEFPDNGPSAKGNSKEEAERCLLLFWRDKFVSKPCTKKNNEDGSCEP